MPTPEPAAPALTSKTLTEAAIRIGVIGFLIFVCVLIVAPFMGLMLWATVLAIALYPLHQMLARALGDRPRSAATLVVIAGLLLIGGPTAMLGGSFANQMRAAYVAFDNDALVIPQPKPEVAQWPVVGAELHSAWQSAADNLPVYLKENQAQLRKMLKPILSAVASTAGSVLLFMGAFVIAGAVMAYGPAGTRTARSIFTSLAGPARGPRLQHLSTETVRSVANGVIGVAFVQALLLGLGFALAGVPGAGILAVIALLFAIAQLPVALISLPVIGYLWWLGDGSTASNIAFSAYLIIAGMVDNVLKPMLLGRGVDAPMPVILLGALGGMMASGIIGLFLGAVLLTVGYKVFMEWVEVPDEGA